MRKGEILVVEDAPALALKAAEIFTECAEEAARRKGVFTAALSGGSTPAPLYRILASGEHSFRARVPWERAHFFWADERCVPANHEDSNYRLVKDLMLSRIPVPPGNVHPVDTRFPDASDAASGYERLLREFFHAGSGAWPRFDLVLLGMGKDGHTASLFPGTEVLAETERLVAAQWVEKLGAFRITLTPPVLNHSALVVFLVSGGDKAATLRDVLCGPASRQELPAQLVAPADGRLLWIADRDAARLLPEKTTNHIPPSPASSGGE
jgi:6-phosphogluconolactonase